MIEVNDRVQILNGATRKFEYGTVISHRNGVYAVRLDLMISVPYYVADTNPYIRKVEDEI